MKNPEYQIMNKFNKRFHVGEIRLDYSTVITN